jgi:hypothetical protein
MQPDELRRRPQGVVSFPVTPFKRDLSLDLDLLEFLERRGQKLNRKLTASVRSRGRSDVRFSGLRR